MRLLLVIVLAILILGLVPRIPQTAAQTETPLPTIASPDATPDAITDIVKSDSATECDAIARVIPADANPSPDDPQINACTASGFSARASCTVKGDTVLFETVTIRCMIRLKNESPSQVFVDLTDVRLITDDGRYYLPRPVYVSSNDDSPIAVGEQARFWIFDVDIPQETHLPALLVLDMGEHDFTFVIETLSVPAST